MTTWSTRFFVALHKYSPVIRGNPIPAQLSKQSPNGLSENPSNFDENKNYAVKQALIRVLYVRAMAAESGLTKNQEWWKTWRRMHNPSA